MRLTALLSKIPVHKGYRYGMHRPWTFAAQRNNPPWRIKKHIWVEPIDAKDWTLFKGDWVEVHKGKDKGKQGKVVQVFRHRNWVVVGGLNTHYRYIGKTEDYRGTYIVNEAPLLIYDVSLVDPTDKQPTKVEWKYTEEGERVRVSVRTGRIIPKPPVERRDGIVPEEWIDGPKDTSPEDVTEKTYVPSLKVLEEEVMEKMGIVEHRRHRKSYYY